MIRRDAGEDFLLITQTDHAELAAKLAAHFGNDRFAKPTVAQPPLTAVTLHDAGWALHDENPTLNAHGQPLDFTEAPRSITLPAWAASAAHAAEANPYAGLLVSLHSLSLSIFATSPAPGRSEKFDVQKMHDQFDINKFQHREVERQEQLRRVLKFRMDIPVKHGLADAHASPEDDRLRFDFRLLQAMDLLSICLCCSALPAAETQEVLPAPKADPIKLKITRSVAGILHVKPWPFNVAKIYLTVLCRRVSRRRFESLETFRAAYHAAPAESFQASAAKC